MKQLLLFLFLSTSLLTSAQRVNPIQDIIINNHSAEIKCKVKNFDAFLMTKGFFAKCNNEKIEITPNIYTSFTTNGESFLSQKIDGDFLFLKVIQDGRVTLMSHDYMSSVVEDVSMGIITEDLKTDYYIINNTILHKIDANNFKKSLNDILPDATIKPDETFVNISKIISRYNE